MIKDRILEILQRIGRAFMLPIAILPITGFLLGLGSSMTNEVMLEAYSLSSILGHGTMLHAVFETMHIVGSTVFDNLPVIFAVGVAIGMARKEKEVAALSAGIAYMTMISTVNACLVNSGKILPDGSISDAVLAGTVTEIMGVQTLQMGVFGGIITGLGVAFLHNHFRKVSLPSVFSFFSGKRFIPIISVCTYMIVGVLMYQFWPIVQKCFYHIGLFLNNTGYWGTLLYGIIKRALIPFGLHHVFYFPFWHTAVGGSMEIGGKIIEGGQNIFFAQLADPATQHFSVQACRFFSGEFIFMIFGLPGAALAMYHTAKEENKKKVGGLLLSAALTCILTGITEPIEFCFIFVAPMLFFVQVVLAGFAYMLAQILDIAIGLTFSGGFLDFLFFGILQGDDKTGWMRVLPVGAVYFILYYVIFRFLILKYDLKTPGREKTNHHDLSHVPYKDTKERVEIIARGLGGRENIIDVDSCATRLHCTLADKMLVDEKVLKNSGASAYYYLGNGIRLVYGPDVTKIKRFLDHYLQDPQGWKMLLSEQKNHKENDLTKIIKKKNTSSSVIYSPMNGKILPLAEVPDLVFSSEILGKGCAIIPTEGKVYAPMDGTITKTFETNHAIMVTGTDGEEILMHFGLGTSKLRGEGFERAVKEGQVVFKGDLLMSFDPELFRQKGYETISPILIANTDDYNEIKISPDKEVSMGDIIFTLRNS